MSCSNPLDGGLWLPSLRPAPNCLLEAHMECVSFRAPASGAHSSAGWWTGSLRNGGDAGAQLSSQEGEAMLIAFDISARPETPGELKGGILRSSNLKQPAITSRGAVLCHLGPTASLPVHRFSQHLLQVVQRNSTLLRAQKQPMEAEKQITASQGPILNLSCSHNTQNFLTKELFPLENLPVHRQPWLQTHTLDLNLVYSIHPQRHS